MKLKLKPVVVSLMSMAMVGPVFAAEMITEVGDGEGQVNIVAWP